jgi:hypothetical protein
MYMPAKVAPGEDPERVQVRVLARPADHDAVAPALARIGPFLTGMPVGFARWR